MKPSMINALTHTCPQDRYFGRQGEMKMRGFFWPLNTIKYFQMKSSVKNIYSFLICGLLILVSSGCSKFLDEKDPSNLTVESFYTKPADAESAVNAIYQSVNGIYSGAYGFGGGLSPWLMLEFATGLAETDLGEATPNLLVRSLTNNADNSEGKLWWDLSYQGIANANLAISKIPGISMDENEKKQLLGQAKFLRAFYYYNLVRIFGNIPLITSTVSLSSPDMYPKQDSVANIYSLIVQDLMSADSAGLPYLDASGRVSQGAVQSLLASVYLTMAGYPLNKGTAYYQKAADEAEKVIQSGKYSLFPSYDDLHTPDKKNTGENIFMAQYAPYISPSGWQSAIIPYNMGISAYDSQSGAIFVNQEFADSYEKGDKRAEEKQFFYTKYTLSADRSKTIDLGGTYIYKLFDVEAQNTTASSGLNWPIMRYAEVLLIYAEASNEVSGPTPQAYDAINKIRERAELPKLSGLSKDQFRKAVWEELWHELCYEDKTWFNMVRLRKAYNPVTDNFDNFVGHKFTYGPVLQEKDLLFPIPQYEIDNNKNLVQNAGY